MNAGPPARYRFPFGRRAARAVWWREALAIGGYALLGAASTAVSQAQVVGPARALAVASLAPLPPPPPDVAPARPEAAATWLALSSPTQAPAALLEPTETVPRSAEVIASTRRGLEAAELEALRLAARADATDVGDRLPGSPLYPVSEGTLPARAEEHRAPEGWSDLRGPGMAVRPHPRVVAYLEHFARDAQGRRTFRHWLRQSGRYRDVVAQAFAKRNLPPGLAAVVFVESGGQPTAVSRAGAVGLWQFMPETARAYGLSIGPYVDERRSVGRSTEAAVAHLSDLYDRFLSWDMALAAYNLGYQGLVDRADALGHDDYWALADRPGGLPSETTAYVPKVLAVALLLSNLDRFGFDGVALAPPIEASELEVPPGTPLATVARAAGTSLATLKALNPELLRGALPADGDPLSLHVPSAGWARARIMLPRLLAERDGLEDDVAESFDWGRDELSSERPPRR